MPHTSHKAILRCIDFRLTKPLNDWLVKCGMLENCDVIAVGGSTKVIADNENSCEGKYLLNQIGLAQKLHGISHLYLIHHTDCGAYGGSKTFANQADECSKHAADLKSAADIVRRLFPNLAVQTMIYDMVKEAFKEV